jgi:ParB family transcriptional regulator, chromosome partitioning protein
MTERSTEWGPGVARAVPIARLGTTLGRVRCPQPAQVARMRQSLSRHGQLTAVIAVERAGTLELVDGFKRRTAAAALGWPDLAVSVRPLDGCGQWTAMLTLNRTSGSLSMLEEGLIVRELCQSGLTQVEIAQVVGRHKSWVSRRLGLVERLHPELLAAVRTGLLAAGVARRLLGLPPGNQLELAAVATQAGLTTGETELLVSLWQQTSDPAIRRFLLTDPRRALQNARAETGGAPPDPRLSERGRRLLRVLAVLRGVARRLLDALRPLPPRAELALLAEELAQTAQTLPRALEALGSARRCVRSGESAGPSATPKSTDC